MAEIGYSLPSGAVVWIDANDEESDTAGATESYGREDVGAGRPFDVVGKFKEALGPIEEITKLLFDSIVDATQKPTSVTLEFGVNLKGKAGISLVSGEAGAQLKVKLAWKPPG